MRLYEEKGKNLNNNNINITVIIIIVFVVGIITDKFDDCKRNRESLRRERKERLRKRDMIEGKN
jgi:nitrogen fixation-related uncharacterized protein